MQKTTSKAAGAYLRLLRESRKLGRPTIANMIKTSENQIKRIEEGVIDSRGSLWLAFCQAVNGNAADLEYLMNQHGSTQADGQQLAQEWLAAQTHPMTEEECHSMQAGLKDWFYDQTDLQSMSAEDAARWRSALALLRRLLRQPPGISAK